jgi:hypothetical protein
MTDDDDDDDDAEYVVLVGSRRGAAAAASAVVVLWIRNSDCSCCSFHIGPNHTNTNNTVASTRDDIITDHFQLFQHPL